MTSTPPDLAARAGLEAALLARRAKRTATGIPRLPRPESGGTFPLSPSQRLMWRLHHASPSGSTWVTLGGVRLHGPLDLAALEQAFTAVTERHEALRTLFGTDEHGDLVQAVQPAAPVSVPVTEVTPDGAEAAMATVFDEPFDLREGPLVRLRVLRLGPQEHHLVLVVHHIISDGRTMEIIIAELTACYFAFAAGLPSPLPPLRVQVADVAVWQNQRLSASRQRLLDYWLPALEGATGVLPPTDAGPRPTPDSRGCTYQLPLAAETVQALRHLGSTHHATLFMVTLAACHTLLSWYTGVRDGAVASPYTYRDRPEIDHLAGAFMNYLVLRADLSGDPTFTEVLGRIRDRTAADFEHHELPVGEIMTELGHDPTADPHPLLRSLFTEESNPALPPQDIDALRIEMINDPPWRRAERDFTLRVTHGTAGTHVIVTYRTDAFTPARVRDIAADYRDLLERIAAGADFKLFDAQGRANAPGLRVPPSRATGQEERGDS
ncbi:condensation domain-containing protein [Streptomyces decoyicus]|uniref:condensation domain-containing protein n=1 Tax=Streptomyces decoyicus TaxID=249567 RepID=UPI002E17BAEF|nr:condensation domain-containing protein [Streptomyces decoyicus]